MAPFAALTPTARLGRYERGSNNSAPPNVWTVTGGSQKVRPGVSSFATNPAGAGASIHPLLDLASGIVPAAEQARTIVFLRATGGMRLVPEPQRKLLYDSLYDAMRAHPCAIKASREAFDTLTGELEGVYGFLSVNHLLARAGQVRRAPCESDVSPEPPRTRVPQAISRASTASSRCAPVPQITQDEIGSVGALDLGGASTQITTPLPRAARENSAGAGTVSVVLPGRRVY